jgi:hypothetical protein
MVPSSGLFTILKKNRKTPESIIEKGGNGKNATEVI